MRFYMAKEIEDEEKETLLFYLNVILRLAKSKNDRNLLMQTQFAMRAKGASGMTTKNIRSKRI
jgi:hypothetical protein